MALTADQLKQYNDQGYLVVENLISKSTIAKMRERINQHVVQREKEIRARANPSEFEKSSGTLTTSQVRKLTELALIDPLLKEVASSSAVLDIVAELAGKAESIYLYNDQAFLKPAFCGSEKPLHQDNSYFRVTPHNFGLTCWVAIDDATEQNGCLRYIPGSHKLGLVKHDKIENTPHLVPSNRSRLAPSMPAPVSAGGAIFHHLLSLHESLDNRSPQSRWAWALHYLNGAADGGQKPLDQMLRVR